MLRIVLWHRQGGALGRDTSPWRPSRPAMETWSSGLLVDDVVFLTVKHLGRVRIGRIIKLIGPDLPGRAEKSVN